MIMEECGRLVSVIIMSGPMRRFKPSEILLADVMLTAFKNSDVRQTILINVADID